MITQEIGKWNQKNFVAVQFPTYAKNWQLEIL